MSKTKQVDDWEVATTISYGGGKAAAAIAFGFVFRSKSLNVCQPVAYTGAGVGAGVKASGSASPGSLTYIPIVCNRAFSINDLDSSPGAIMNVGVSVIVGYSAVFITANNLFSWQYVGGCGVGLDASATFTAGVWMLDGSVYTTPAQKHRGLSFRERMTPRNAATVTHTWKYGPQVTRLPVYPGGAGVMVP